MACKSEDDKGFPKKSKNIVHSFILNYTRTSLGVSHQIMFKGFGRCLKKRKKLSNRVPRLRRWIHCWSIAGPVRPYPMRWVPYLRCLGRWQRHWWPLCLTTRRGFRWRRWKWRCRVRHYWLHLTEKNNYIKWRPACEIIRFISIYRTHPTMWYFWMF